MSKDPKKSPEFKRYRQALTTVYIVVIGLGGILLTASIARALLFRSPTVELTGPKISAENPNPEELKKCNRDVAALLGALGTTTAALMAQPTAEIDRHWEEFSRNWRKDYDEVNARCRFQELANTNLGTAYDRMASVHADLPAMRLKYQDLLVRFDEEQADELGRMQRALKNSLAALEERALSAPPE